MPAQYARPYESLATRVAAAVPDDADQTTRLRTVVDVLWEGLHAQGVSWVGFYLPSDEGALVLGPSRDKPACSPIGRHGVCGRCLATGQPIVVDDVATLGEDYVACDPQDRSEVVVPFRRSDGAGIAGVLDLDSYDVAAFDDADVWGLRQVLTAASLSI